jgi:hypothetical protein
MSASTDLKKNRVGERRTTELVVVVVVLVVLVVLVVVLVVLVVVVVLVEHCDK